MKIPTEFILDAGKLAYLLRSRVKDDKSKYLIRAGFTMEKPSELETAIRAAVRLGDAALDQTNEFGSFYILRASLKGIDGTGLDVKMIFQHRNDESWSFVTLYPYKE